MNTMAGMTVYYDNIEGKECPIWMGIYFGRGEIPWEKSYTYIPTIAPFTRVYRDEFSEDVLSISVTPEDLIIPENRKGWFGINLRRVLARALKNKNLDPNEIQQFLIQMSDINELLRIDAVRFYLP